MGLANVTEENEHPYSSEYSDEEVANIRENEFPKLQEKNYKQLSELGFQDEKISHRKSIFNKFLPSFNIQTFRIFPQFKIRWN